MLMAWSAWSALVVLIRTYRATRDSVYFGLYPSGELETLTVGISTKSAVLSLIITVHSGSVKRISMRPQALKRVIILRIIGLHKIQWWQLSPKLTRRGLNQVRRSCLIMVW